MFCFSNFHVSNYNCTVRIHTLTHLARERVEAAGARAEDRRANEGRDAAHHVHDAAAGEVDHADV